MRERTAVAVYHIRPAAQTTETRVVKQLTNTLSQYDGCNLRKRQESSLMTLLFF